MLSDQVASPGAGERADREVSLPVAISKYDVEVDLADKTTSHALMVDLIGSNKRVLDVGCSTGYLAKVLGAFGNVVSGIETDAPSAERALPFLDRVVVGDLEADDPFAQFDDRSFDVVVFGDVLEHLRDPLPVLRRARSLLVPGGSVVISVPNIAHGDVRLALLKGNFTYRNVGLLDETHVHFFTRESLRVFIADAGFVAVDVRVTSAPLFGTELGVVPSDYPADVVAEIARDADATTYQFVLRAVPDDATQAEHALAWRTQELGVAVAALEHRLAEQKAAHGAALVAVEAGHADALTAMRDRMDGLATQLGAERERTARAEAELATLAGTRLLRSTDTARKIYSAVRRVTGK